MPVTQPGPTQPGVFPWYKGASKDAHQGITRATTMAAKLEAIDAYIDSKVNVYLDMRMNPHDQSAFLRRKIQRLASCLPDSDAELLRARGDYFIEHIAGLCTQWSLKSTFRTCGSATAAFLADRAYNWSDGLTIIKQYLLKSTHNKQGPRARFEAMRETRREVQAATAFPKPAQWETELDLFMQHQATHGLLADPGYFSEAVASALSSAPEHKVAGIADRYFYSKIVTPWSVSVNQGHIDDKLYALLPQLESLQVQHVVQHRANCCKANMPYLLRNHITHQSRQIHAAEYAAEFVHGANGRNSVSDGAALSFVHAGSSSTSTAAAAAGGVCFVYLPDGACQIARQASC